MNKIKFARKFVLGFLPIVFFIASGLVAQSNDDVALILKSKGNVKVRKGKNKNWQDGNRGKRLDSGDIIKTYEQALAAIMFTDDKSLLKVRDNSTLAIRGKRTKQSIAKRIACKFGDFWIKVSKQKSKLLVETPSGVAAVKGTEFYCIVDSEGNTHVLVIEGIVELMNKLGKALAKAGQTGKLVKGQSPKVSPTDPDSVPDWAGDDKQSNELQFEFEDSDGNKKNLKIIYH